MLPRLLHKVAAAAQLRRERSIAHVACGARAAAVPRDALEPRAPRTVSEHPVALHATAARGGDAPAQVEPPKRRAAQHGAAAAACIPEFDLILFPNKRHGYGDMSNYMMRRKWDYFVKHLKGLEPPKGFSFN